MSSSSPEKEILYLTSFNKELYEASGKKLIESYKKTNQLQYSNLLCTYENMPLPVDENIIFFDITNNKILTNFLNLYSDKIPKYLGGKTEPCKCKNPCGKQTKDHIRGCYFTWWNRNCFRWFKKVVSLVEAAFSSAKYLIWIDSDCEFKKQITSDFIKNLFQDNTVIFMKGNGRIVDETGFFGIKLDTKGREFINRLYDFYMNGDVFNLIRWDDGYVFTKLHQRMYPYIKSRDLVLNSNGSRVMERSLIKQYVIHNKGIHGEKKIML